MVSYSSEEIEKFNKLAHDWWNPKGQFKPLHDFNPVRVNFIRSLFQESLSEIKTIDVGCGGGLVSSSLCRLGSDVTGIDASPAAIYVAKKYAQEAKLDISYEQLSPEEYLAAEPEKKFDLVVALEIIEHVSDPKDFMQSLATLTKPGGFCVISTINRTMLSYLVAIIGAEYVMRMLPKGTHEWKKFLKPDEVTSLARSVGLKPIKLQGLRYNPFSAEWDLGHKTPVNFIIALQKPA